jgi:hypothetical protein
MSAQESSSGDQQQNYLSKRVMINGQFVTLYSANGQTWLSSPEEIPDMMARLDNTRVILGEAKDPEGDKKDSKDDKAGKEKEAAPVAKAPGSQYRMKGPKPRPILRQGGKVVEGTPIEPISGSAVNIKGAADTTIPTVKLSPMEQGIRRGKIVAPIAQKRPGKPKVTPPTPSKNNKLTPSEVKGSLGGKGKAAMEPKRSKAPPVAPKDVTKGVKKVAAQVKQAKAPAKAKVVKKVAAKPIKEAKRPIAKGKKVSAVKKSSAKPVAKKRSR